MQKRDTRECLLQAMDMKARLATLILCDTSSAVPSLDPRSLMHFQLLSFDVSKYSVLSTLKRRLYSAKMDSHELTIVIKIVELALAGPKYQDDLVYIAIIFSVFLLVFFCCFTAGLLTVQMFGDGMPSGMGATGTSYSGNTEQSYPGGTGSKAV